MDNPDFVYGRSVDCLAEKVITAYVAQGTYVPVGRIEDVYDDILNLGRIFGVEDRGLELIGSMKQEIGQVHEQIGSVEKPLRVFAFDSGDQAAFTAGQSLSSQLIEFAGGKNIFDDIAKSWAEVSWEEVVNRDPEVILIYDYDQPSTEEKIQFLKNHSALQNVTAIQNDHFVVLKLSDVFEGVRNTRAVQTMAKAFIRINSKVS
ncbi:ABC transporter substrate-binding protein [Ammoniphilus sp. YIM 78166]|uniref:ABC transporter substrate-binding protein n=1 Tax=Ammoniphilus sp. YIM 78166 TaxID=1644106 RepID=UPI001F118190|nr:ABC transporter substrate-binding protein [Ammoniphilus sp. YIM 78166]